MALYTHSILSYAEALAEVHTDPTQVTAETTKIEDLLNLITDGIERYLDRRVVWRAATSGATFYTEFHTIRERATLIWLRNRPVFSFNLLEVKESLTRDWAGTTALITDQDFVLSAERGKLERLQSGFSSTTLQGQSLWWPSGYVSPFASPFWMAGPRVIRIKYKAGYADTASVPGSIKGVARELFATRYREIKRGMQGVTSKQDEAGNITRFGPAILTSEQKERIRSEMRYPGSSTGELETVAA